MNDVENDGFALAIEGVQTPEGEIALVRRSSGDVAIGWPTDGVLVLTRAQVLELSAKLAKVLGGPR